MADRFSPSIEDAVSMTHQPELPNPAAPWIERAKRFYSGGLADVLAKENRIPQSLNENWLSRALRSRGLADAMQTWNPLIEGFIPIGRGVRMGWPDIGRPKELSLAANANVESLRTSVLNKLIANRDFRPQLLEGRMWFRSLSPAENEVINRMGWGRADHVTFEDEMSPERGQWAWEQNIRHWLKLSSPR